MNEPATPKPNTGIKKQLAIGIISFGLGLLSFWVASMAIAILTHTKGLDTSLLYNVKSVLSQKYDGNINYSKMSEGAAAGAVASLGDPYTVYLDEKSNKELADDLKGEISGIGIEVGQKAGKLTVIAPVDGTPAAKAGIKSGDYIISIDGIDTAGLTIDEAVARIRGDKGTDVKLGIIRGSEPPKEITITRDIITFPSVTHELKADKIGYIKIRRFGDDTTELVRSAGKSLARDGAKAIIVDVRDNPGGYLESSVGVASEFMSSGLVVQERSSKSKPKSHNATEGGTMTNLPIIVLINRGSASASEILAGALNDNKRATLVGEKSYGKGSVQEVVCLESVFLSSSCKGASVKVTVAHWYTPGGVDISKEGIKPTVEVGLTTKDSDAGIDPQLDRAIELAKQSR